jgi:hypothetical protein
VTPLEQRSFDATRGLPARSAAQLRSSPSAMLLITALWTAFVTWLVLVMKHHDPGFWPIQIVVLCSVPLFLFFPRTTTKRILIYICVQGIRSVLVVVIAWCFQGWTSALVYGAMSLGFLSFDYNVAYRIWLTFRKPQLTPDVTPLGQWLSEATRGLSAESSEQVRAEIQQHYDLACEAGDDGIAALGDPQAANRAYRKVLLTKGDVLRARDLNKPKRPSWLLGGCIYFLSGQHAGSALPITISIFSTVPLAWFFPMLEQSRMYVYLHGVRLILSVAAIWWYADWISALVLGAVLFLWDHSTIYRRRSISRKLGLST